MVRKIEACGVEKDTMINNLIIRQETEEDYKKTELMIMRSFWNKYWPGCTEHLLTRIIRDSQEYIPEISRIAEIDGQIVGAIYYTKAWIVDGNSRHEIATFGPLAVEPTWEGNDIGGALMRETIKLAQKQGIAGIVIIGEPYYYPRFGFHQYGEKPLLQSVCVSSERQRCAEDGNKPVQSHHAQREPVKRPLLGHGGQYAPHGAGFLSPL